ncbi:MAG: hypothetical protein EA361_15835 [Bacteroidetes bacterium]|nr:MAG: hypothetical protein EA361_15835 [Bacteroidota bacterium]
MTLLKSIFAGMAVMLLVSAAAMSQAKVIAVVNHADWCGTCKANGERAMTVFSEFNPDGTIQFVVNDLTNDATKKASAKTLKEHGLYKAMEEKRKTALVYFFDAQSKELINEISVGKSNEEIASAMKTAQKGSKSKID